MATPRFQGQGQGLGHSSDVDDVFGSRASLASASLEPYLACIVPAPPPPESLCLGTSGATPRDIDVGDLKALIVPPPPAAPLPTDDDDLVVYSSLPERRSSSNSLQMASKRGPVGPPPTLPKQPNPHGLPPPDVTSEYQNSYSAGLPGPSWREKVTPPTLPKQSNQRSQSVVPVTQNTLSKDACLPGPSPQLTVPKQSSQRVAVSAPDIAREVVSSGFNTETSFSDKAAPSTMPKQSGRNGMPSPGFASPLGLNQSQHVPRIEKVPPPTLAKQSHIRAPDVSDWVPEIPDGSSETSQFKAALSALNLPRTKQQQPLGPDITTGLPRRSGSLQQYNDEDDDDDGFFPPPPPPLAQYEAPAPISDRLPMPPPPLAALHKAGGGAVSRPRLPGEIEDSLAQGLNGADVARMSRGGSFNSDQLDSSPGLDMRLCSTVV